ncbi:MAG: tetratricopeptide repeat protein [Thermoflexibacteraceae bacterium]
MQAKQANLYLANYYTANQQKDKALAHYQAILAIYPEDVEAKEGIKIIEGK